MVSVEIGPWPFETAARCLPKCEDERIVPYASTPMMSDSFMIRSSSPSSLTSVPDHLPNSTRSPTLTSIGISLPASSRPPGLP